MPIKFLFHSHAVDPMRAQAAPARTSAMIEGGDFLAKKVQTPGPGPWASPGQRDRGRSAKRPPNARLYSPVVLFALVSLSGCVTIGRFEEMEARVIELERQAATTKERTDMHEVRLENLNTILKRSEADLRQGYAATTSTVEELEDRLRRALGTLEGTQHLVERNSKLLGRVAEFLDKQHGTTMAALPDNLPTDPDKLFVAGLERLKANQHKEARAIFREFINRNATSPKAAEAQYNIAESFIGERDYDRAVGELKAVWSAYRDSPIAPNALYRIGDVLVMQGQCTKAKQVYELVVREVPKSDAATRAKSEIKTVSSRCK